MTKNITLDAIVTKIVVKNLFLSVIIIIIIKTRQD